MEDTHTRSRPPVLSPELIAMRHLLGRCLGELREWRARRQESARFPQDFYARVETALRQARRAPSVSEVRARVGEIEIEIRDRGPLDDAFLPGLESLHERLSQVAIDPTPGGS